MTNPQNLPQAALVFLTRVNYPIDEVLVVPRPHLVNAYGLPGGKVEPRETVEQAAARELLEETGLKAERLRLIYEGADDGDYWTSTFLAEGHIERVDRTITHWEWLSYAVLTRKQKGNQTWCPYAQYNRGVLAAVYEIQKAARAQIRGAK